MGLIVNAAIGAFREYRVHVNKSSFIHIPACKIPEFVRALT